MVGPIPGREPESDPAVLTMDDFAIDERPGDVDACPAGHVPLVVERDQEGNHANRDAAGGLWGMSFPQCLPDQQGSGRPLHDGVQ